MTTYYQATPSDKRRKKQVNILGARHKYWPRQWLEWGRQHRWWIIIIMMTIDDDDWWWWWWWWWLMMMEDDGRRSICLVKFGGRQLGNSKYTTLGGTTLQAEMSLQLLVFLSGRVLSQKKSSKQENGQKNSAYGHGLSTSTSTSTSIILQDDGCSLFFLFLLFFPNSQEHDPWWFMVHPRRIIILLQITTAFILCNLAHLISISYDDHQQHPGISSINHITNHTWEPGSSKQPGALQVPRMHSTTSTADQEEARSNWVPIILLLGQ